MPTVSEIISQILLKKLREEKLTPQEAATLAEWEGRSPEHSAFISMLMDEAALSDKIKDMLASTEQEPWQRIERALAEEWNDRAEPVKKKINWTKYATAASLVLLVGFAVYYFTIDKPAVNKTIVAKKAATINEVMPGGKSALLFLSDNTEIDLSTAANGKLADQDGAIVIKKEDGKLEYDQNNKATSAQNFLSIPRGGFYQLTLPDKTNIWLNAASSIRYPVNFNSSERKVEITGEAYFEVARDTSRKFVVVIKNSVGTRKSEIEVLGTQFNVRAYDDEAITASLVEGKIKMADAELKPGQQAQITIENTIKITDANLEQALAWKNGNFDYDADIHTILHEIARWYNIDVVIEGQLPNDIIIFKTPRNTPFTEVVKALQLMGVNCHFENGTLVVKPQ